MIKRKNNKRGLTITHTICKFPYLSAMGSRFYDAPLMKADKEYLLIIAGRRWKTAWKRFLLTAMLPMVIAIPMLAILNLVILANLDEAKEAEDAKDINIPEGIENFSLLWYAIPIFIVLLIVNAVMFVISIPPLYIDIWRGKKKQLFFQPQPYTIAATGKYYIATGLPALRFIEVTGEQYMNMDYNRPCYLEVTPLTNIPLGFKTIEVIE